MICYIWDDTRYEDNHTCSNKVKVSSLSLKMEIKNQNYPVFCDDVALDTKLFITTNNLGISTLNAFQNRNHLKALVMIRANE